MEKNRGYRTVWFHSQLQLDVLGGDAKEKRKTKEKEKKRPLIKVMLKQPKTIVNFVEVLDDFFFLIKSCHNQNIMYEHIEPSPCL